MPMPTQNDLMDDAEDLMDSMMMEEDEEVGGDSFTRDMRRKDDSSLRAYLDGLDTGDVPVQFSVTRLWPKMINGRVIGGHIETIDELLDEDGIKLRYGGGKYKVVIKAPDNKGRMIYRGSRTVEVAGSPIVDGVVMDAVRNASDEQRAPQESDSVSTRAMEMANEIAARSEQRAQDIERRLYEMSNKPKEDSSAPLIQMLMQQMSDLRADMTRKDERIAELITKSADSANQQRPTDMLFGKMLEGESTRLESMRTQHDSELRQLRQSNEDEKRHIHENYERQIQRLEDRNEREIASLKQSYENQIAFLRQGSETTTNTTKFAYESQLESLKRELKSLENSLAAKDVEIAELRAKKEKSFIESLQEITHAREALDSMNPVEGPSTLDKFMGAAGPVIETIAARALAQGPQQNQPPEQQAQAQAQLEQQIAALPPGKSMQLPGGQVVSRREDGSLVEIKPKPKPPEPTGEDVEIEDGQLNMLMQVMETQLKDDVSPEEFIKKTEKFQQYTGPFKVYLKAKGVDALFARMETLRPRSDLLQQHGRNWVRKVATLLLT